MAGLVIELGHKEPDEDEKPDGYSSDLESTMKDFLKGVADKDPKMMAAAFEAAHAVCAANMDSEKDMENEK